MKPAHPKLITFSISHFCEKARWGLDWHGLTYEEVCWPIGLHRVLAKLYGARSSTLPILLNDGAVLQGSSEIIDWADQIISGSKRRLTVPGAREIEQRADSVLGIHVRRLYYAEMLPRSSSSVKMELFRGLSTTQRLIGNVMWPVTRRLMMRAMDIAPGAAVDSRAIVEFELDWLDGLLDDDRPYLAGDRFSRADIAVASLLAPLARPKQMATSHRLRLPTPLMNDVKRWRERPVMRWIRLNYLKQRNFMPSSRTRS